MPSSKFRSLLVMLAVVLTGIGTACRKRTPATDASQGEVISKPGPAAKPLAGSSEARIPTQEDIYQATRKFLERHKRAATTPEELVSAGLLAPLPPAPSGKKYILDQRAANLRLVDQ